MAKAKRIKGIECNSEAPAGMKLVLVTRFGELSDFRNAALDWTDPEGVHSMRVASRRLRSALRDFMPYLRKRRLASVLKPLRDIADALGEVRDQDVAIMALEKLQTHVAVEVSSLLQQLIDARKEIRDEARKELETMLEDSQLKQLELSFIAGVDEATTEATARTPSPLLISFRKMSRAIILDRLKELEKLSNGLFRPFEVEDLHDMRIAAKRLRYAIELFQQCWGRSMATYAKRTARLQTALGDVHDCDVWIESFGTEINGARKQKQDENLKAFVWLLSHFVKLRTKHVRKAFELWRDWEAQDTSGKLRTLLNTEPKPARRRRETKVEEESVAAVVKIV
ncbi:MAG TPA: CHAD domain-containing protein [Pyrinomonadaceae bacterium]|jgi:CHAD domain-containing protein|nr:CHAD domain-containing protein [Pyrinomonadaceae bacterium]